MYSIPRPLCNSVTTFLPHNKPFSTTLALASKSVSQLQRRALKLPASTGISTDYTASKEEAAPKENAVPNSKLSTPTASSTLGSFNLARSKVLSKENDHDHDAYDLIRPLLKENGGKWLLTADKKGIERVFRFRGFKAAWVGFSPFLLSFFPLPGFELGA
ncbi:hypothetical protein DSL72_000659 [Monilinia vaccinii-corymbosi]|uniref:Uncharacterized protein n=1 Tax=Monilinia vaccinii-corymbosi TaxID=61207 RepID=A0A8A3P8N9_9HELO|nr:hypothetical protein DSL72_000659 [Monilinia vaccinii-corymbosi]